MNRADRRAPFRRAPLLIEFGPNDLDGSVDGLWIEVRRLDVAALREITGLADQIKGGATVNEIEILTVKVEKSLIDWNWTHPVTGEFVDPRSPGAVDTLDGDVLMALIDRMQGALEGVEADLGKESGSSPSSPANGTNPAPIPVTGNPGLSAALANLPMHSG